MKGIKSYLKSQIRSVFENKSISNYIHILLNRALSIGNNPQKDRDLKILSVAKITIEQVNRNG